jgi:aryl-alcohol dehydrogenase-like predicted oxidoreductase
MTLILGTAQIGMSYGVANTHGQPSFDDAVAMLRHPAVTALDTAPGYGTAEHIIGAAGVLVPVTTKLDPAVSPAESVTRSCERLGRETLDAVLLHDAGLVDDDPHGVIDAATRLVENGTIGRLGASVYTPAQLAAVVLDPRLTMCQIPLHALDHRWSDALLARAATTGTTVVARSVFLQGALLMEPQPLPSHLASLAPALVQLRSIAREHERTVAELLIAAVRDRDGIAGLVLGADHFAHLDELAAAMSTPLLTATERSALAAIGALSDAVLDPRRWTSHTTPSPAEQPATARTAA